MPRFFFDTFVSFDIDAGDRSAIDVEGQEFPDAVAASVAALRSLPELAADWVPDGDRHSVSTDVRDQTGRVVYTATLSLAGRWHE